MRELRKWIDRVLEHEAIWISEQAVPGSEPSAEVRTFPLAVRGYTPFNVGGTFFSVEPQGILPQRIGDSGPTALSHLKFFDWEPSILSQRAIVEQFAALTCIALDGWIEAPPAIPFGVEGIPNQLGFLSGQSAVDMSLNRPLGDYSTEPLGSWLTCIKSLSDRHAEVLGAAISLHHGSVLLFERDLRAAYLLLVAAVEILSREFGEPPNNWEAWEDAPRWDKLLSRLKLSKTGAACIRSELLKDKHLRLKQTFRDYAARTLEESFWDAFYSTWHYPHHVHAGVFGPAELFRTIKIDQMLTRDRGELARALGKSYDLRSGLVHRGETVNFLEGALMHDAVADGSKMLPFPVLRLILQRLIVQEMSRLGVETQMPTTVASPVARPRNEPGQ